MKNIAKRMLDFTLEDNHSLSITVDIEDWYHKTFLQAKSFTIKPLKKV